MQVPEGQVVREGRVVQRWVQRLHRGKAESCELVELSFTCQKYHEKQREELQRQLSGTVAAWKLPGDEAADDRASATDDEILAKMCFDLVSARAERARVEAVGEKPREMYRIGLPLIFWLALDAKSRHWVKRRCGKYNPHKLMFKVIGFVLWNLMLDLQRAGFEPDLETLKIAVEESGLLEQADVYFLENYQDRWDALWVATPGDGKHKQVVKVC